VFPKVPNIQLYTNQKKNKQKNFIKFYTSHGSPCDLTCTLIEPMTN
jgi:hypothetical protein